MYRGNKRTVMRQKPLANHCGRPNKLLVPPPHCRQYGSALSDSDQLGTEL
jgi:hypothetical protein